MYESFDTVLNHVYPTEDTHILSTLKSTWEAKLKANSMLNLRPVEKSSLSRTSQNEGACCIVIVPGKRDPVSFEVFFPHLSI